GLTTETETKVASRVPYLSRIPVLGELFKYRSESREKRSLVIFITPHLVHSAEDAEYLLQQELLRRRGELRNEIDSLLDPNFKSE
ncbi:MAG: general secretion pathway protein D, partial [Planctomycetota bacterium]